MPEQSVWTWRQLLDSDLGKAVAWVTPSVANRVPSNAPFMVAFPNETLPTDVDTFVVIGGGKLIDRAKVTARTDDRHVRLVAVPTIWGSGAEASPITVLDRPGKKEILVDAKYVPDVRVIWPETATTVSAEQARWACGDVWSHALEGFLSPLAQDDVRRELAAVLREISTLPMTNDPRWFEPSARACAGQARAGVGLIHGIAHQLEPLLHVERPGEPWGHARLCALLLRPVMEFNRSHSEKWPQLAEQYGVDRDAVDRAVRELFDAPSYGLLLPLLERSWMGILRDPCTRMNSALVRQAHLSFFKEGSFA